MELPPEVSQKLEQFEALRQTLYAILMQKQKLKQQYDEIENAINELEKIEPNKKVYKMVGNVMIEKDKDSLINELKEKKEVLEIRLQSLEKQEQKLKEKLEKLQDELEKLLKTTK
ncbi:MAG TPA: prefoldin subunit beta [Candidatus Nanopusillus sp.]|nr:prefoldin subunit beta [Candidatus Nanopusillus sp.]